MWKIPHINRKFTASEMKIKKEIVMRTLDSNHRWKMCFYDNVVNPANNLVNAIKCTCSLVLPGQSMRWMLKMSYNMNKTFPTSQNESMFWKIFLLQNALRIFLKSNFRILYTFKSKYINKIKRSYTRAYWIQDRLP